MVKRWKMKLSGHKHANGLTNAIMKDSVEVKRGRERFHTVG